MLQLGCSHRFPTQMLTNEGSVYMASHSFMDDENLLMVIATSL
jgi:hypothetical protein